MSYSQDLKKDIMNAQYKNPCCRRSLLYGVISSKAKDPTDENISFNIESKDMADYLSVFTKEFFGTDCAISAPPKGGRCKVVTFRSKAVRNYLVGMTAASAFKAKCPSCRMAYLRGVFFACGRASDPDKQFCLEFSLGNKVSIFKDLFEEFGIEMKTITRSKENLLYTKNSTTIEDFFALAELTDATFKIMNVKIANGLKNEANRLRNFDTVNISKAVAAADNQYKIIKELNKRKLLSSLPEELIPTAKMRLENPDMSLSQLALHSTPPISKSGITHRMSRIMKIGEELLKKHG